MALSTDQSNQQDFLKIGILDRSIKGAARGSFCEAPC